MLYLVLIVAVLIMVLLLGNREKRKVGLKSIKRKVILNLPANCPYCQFAFEKRPQRNRKCPNCQSKIILRNGNLLTEEQAEEYDRKKDEQIGKELDRLRRRSLIEQKELGSKYVEISSACDGALCEACKQMNGKRVLLEDELRNPTLPVKNCTSDFCRCSYNAVVD